MIRYHRLDKNSTFTQIVEFMCENLPEDWIMSFDFSEGNASLDLVSPNGIVEFCDDDREMWQMIVERVNHARIADGLQPTEDCCEHGIPEFDYCESCNNYLQPPGQHSGLTK